MPLFAGLLLTGCVTGARPTLGPTVDVGGAAGTATGNAVVDAVLRRLEATPTSSFTATYRIVRKFGLNATTGVVVHDGSDTSITVGNVRFTEGKTASTCSLADHRCEPGTVEARISDYSVGSQFFAGAPARALRVAYSRRSGEPSAATAEVGGVRVACARVPVGTGVETYCASPTGPVARWDTAAIDVELTGLRNAADRAALEAPAG